MSFRTTPDAKVVNLSHVMIMHKPPMGEMDKTFKDRVAYSEYHAAKAILANPDAIVLYEGLTENLTPEVVKKQSSQRILFTAAEIYFPSGFPDTFAGLSELQKHFLVEQGGPCTLFYLGKISHVYKTRRKETDKLVDEFIATGANAGSVFESCEKDAIDFAKEAVRETGKNHVLLVFGALHDYKKRIALLNDPSIIFRDSIDTRDPSSLAAFTDDLYDHIDSDSMSRMIDNYLGKEIKIDLQKMADEQTKKILFPTMTQEKIGDIKLVMERLLKDERVEHTAMLVDTNGLRVNSLFCPSRSEIIEYVKGSEIPRTPKVMDMD
ncbi:MAG: hypothetical protein ACYCQI_13305 [Gammaproteobacteria bacterium]